MQENFNRNNSRGLNSEDNIKRLLSYPNLPETKTLTNLTNSKMDNSLWNLYRSNPTKSPILTELLKSNEIVPYVLQFETNKKNDGPIADTKFNEASNFLVNKGKISDNYNDYIEVSPEHTKQMERMGSENSLFLAIARSLLYNIHFVDEKHESFLCNLFIDDDKRQKLKFDSDLSLQELLRKKLCLYWLSFVNDGKFKPDNCKYAK